jgi:hypothetical protein
VIRPASAGPASATANAAPHPHRTIPLPVFMTDSSLTGVPGGFSAFTRLDAPPPGFIHRPAEDIARAIDRITLVMDIVPWS